MPAYQLHVAVALGVALLVSAVTYVLDGVRTHEKQNTLVVPVEGEEGLSRDPFDVTEPEDLVDGQPVDEERFWNRVRSLPHTVFNPCLGAKGVTLT